MVLHCLYVERQINKRILFIVSKVKLILATMAIGFSSLVSASEIPADMLNLDLKRCKKDCVPAFGEQVCQQLCSCSVREFKKRMDFDQYLDLSARLVRNNLKPEQRVMLDSIAKKCDAEITMPIPAPKKATTPTPKASTN